MLMACLDMYNSEHKSHNEHHQCPRISFSTDFVDSQQAMKQEHGCSRSDSALLVSSDFEFSVTNYSMMNNADELFSKGRLLPFKDNCNIKGTTTTTTLREELLVDEDNNFQEFSLRPPKGSSSTRWKGFLGLRKSHIGSKKIDKSEDSSATSSGLTNEEARINITSQEVLNEGGSNCRDVEIGI